MNDFRMVDGLRAAERIRPLFPPRASNPAARLGLQFERRIKRELQYHVNIGHLLNLEHNPWFGFEDHFGAGTCCPDFLIQTEHCLVVVEVKLTWVESAEPKLRHLYCPVVASAFQGCPTNGIIICKNLTPKAPEAVFTLSEALGRQAGLLHWPNNGHIPWA